MNDPLTLEMIVFNAAVELPVTERDAYVEKSCAGRADLLQRVRMLLRAHEAAGNFLTEDNLSHLADFAAEAAPDSAGFQPERPGDQIGGYRLVREIGEGGCGVVYLAEQTIPLRRRVALKVIKLGMDTKAVIGRFEAERQALALMDHPHIAKVLEAGATAGGRPYFVMELVEGARITDFCNAHELKVTERLALFILVCHAIQHAHQKGVIHRDIKPANILVTWRDGAAMPVVIDFGIAKAMGGRLGDRTVQTLAEQFIGTPAYMSPEQAAGGSQGIDTRSDIYSLGVVLYELLTGQALFDKKTSAGMSLDEQRKFILEKDPARPSTRLRALPAEEAARIARQRRADPPRLIHQVRGDLDWIVMKALEKDRNRRYETASDLAADLKRHLADEPVFARPPGNWYRAQKMIARHRLAMGALAAALLTILTGMGATIHFYLQQRRALHDSLLAEAHARRISGHTGQRFAALAVVQKAAAMAHDSAARDEAIAALALTDMRVARRKNLPAQFAGRPYRFDVPVTRYAVVEPNGETTVRSAADDRLIATLPAPGFTPVEIRKFSSDSRYLIIHYRDANQNPSYWVWDVNRQKAVLTVLAGPLAINFSPDSHRLAKNNPDGTISTYELATGRELSRSGPGHRYGQIAINQANTRLAGITDGSANVEILDMATGANLLTLPTTSPPSAVTWTDDGRNLAVACDDLKIYLWDMRTGKPFRVLNGPVARITRVAFNHNGDLLASSSWDGVMRLWDIAGEQTVADFLGGSDYLEFTPDDRYLGPQSEDGGAVDLLEIVHGGEFRRLHGFRDKLGGAGPEFSPDGRIIVSAMATEIIFWDANLGAEIGRLPVRESWSQLFDPTGRALYLCDRASGVAARPLEETALPGLVRYRLGPARALFPGSGFRLADLSRDGRYLAVAHNDGDEGFVFDLRNPAARVVLSGHPSMDYIALSPDGRWAASGSWQNPLVMIWDARTGRRLRTLKMPARTRIQFSPDGQWLATANQEYQLWRTGTWEPKGAAIPGNPIPEWNMLAFAPDCRTMALTWERSKVQLRETAGERVLATLDSGDPVVLANLQFSPDGTRLAVRRMDGQVDRWNLRLLRQDLSQMQLDWDQPPFPPERDKTGPKPVSLEMVTDASAGD